MKAQEKKQSESSGDDPSGDRPSRDGMIWASSNKPAVAMCFIADALYQIADAIREARK